MSGVSGAADGGAGGWRTLSWPRVEGGEREEEERRGFECECDGECGVCEYVRRERV